MKKNGSLIMGLIALALIILLVNPGWLPLSPETIASIKQLEQEHMLIQRSSMITGAKLLTVLLALAILVFLYIVLKWILNAVGSGSEKSRTFTTLLLGLMKYVFIIAAFVWALSIFGVNTAAVLAGVGLLGLILGFGAQSLIEDIITGFFIIFEGQYEIGDVIILDDFRGTVRSIGVRTTVIEDTGGNLKVVNNSDIRNFQNRSRNNSRALTIVGVSYNTDVKYLEAVLREGLPKMYAAHKDLYLSVPVYMGIEELADSGVNLKFYADVKEGNVFAAQRQLNRDLLVLFKEKNIEIPFPQVDVHMRND
jgi:small conductance mechanosensitive channel